MSGLLARGRLRLLCSSCGRRQRSPHYGERRLIAEGRSGCCQAAIRRESLLEQRLRAHERAQFIADAREGFAIGRLTGTVPK